MPLGRLVPASHFWTVDSLVLRKRAKTGWLTWAASRIRLISFGAICSGSYRHDASKLRIVALSIVPARCKPSAAVWMASNASLLNLDLLGI